MVTHKIECTASSYSVTDLDLGDTPLDLHHDTCYSEVYLVLLQRIITAQYHEISVHPVLLTVHFMLNNLGK
jgi:hypothetical protein